MRVRAASPMEFVWLKDRTECALSPTFRAILAEDNTGIRGMVGFDGWTANAAQMHVCLESPGALRALLRPAFSYLFHEAGRNIALGLVPSHNDAALRFDKHIGFRETYRVKDGWAPGDDMVLLEMRRDECRWLR